MTWADDAARVLDAAMDSGVTVARVFVAPAPRYAKDCSLIAVHLATVDFEHEGGRLPRGFCPVVSIRRFVVTFVRDCYPVGSREEPADPDTITDFSLGFYADVEAIWNALVDADVGAVVVDEAGSIQATVTDGPQGGTVTARFSVSISLDPDPS